MIDPTTSSEDTGIETAAQVDPPQPFAIIRVWHLLVFTVVTLSITVADMIVSIKSGRPYADRIIAGEFIPGYFFYGSFLFYIWILSRTAHLNLRRLTGSLARFKSNFLWLLVTFPLMLSLYPLGDFRWSHAEHDRSVYFHHGPLVAILRVLIVTIIGPIVEELIFRGILLHRSAFLLGRARAIVLTSIVFGLGHNTPFEGFAFAIFMCLLYIKTGSIFVNIGVHMLNNLIAVTLTACHVTDGFLQLLGSPFGPSSLAISVAIMLICLVKLWPAKAGELPFICPLRMKATQPYSEADPI